MFISKQLYNEIIDHALEEPHNEVCGLVASKDNVAQAVYRCINIDQEVGWGGASFTLDPLQQILLLETIQRDGHELGAIYHSHPGMTATPSSIDEGFAENWPGVMWIIVGLRGSWRNRQFEREPDVWSWYMEPGRIRTAELIVEGEDGPDPARFYRGMHDSDRPRFWDRGLGTLEVRAAIDSDGYALRSSDSSASTDTT